MEKKYSAEKPQTVELMGARRRLNYGVWKLSEAELQELWEQEFEHTAPFEYFAKEHRYGYYSLEMGGARWNYNGLIEAIIRDKYTADEMEATINNYLLDPEDEETAKAFNEMQAWRRFAKDTAKEVLGIKE